MRTSFFWATSLLLAMISLTAAAQSDFPDLRGTWTGTDYGVRHYRSPELRAQTHHKAQTLFPEIPFTLKIEKQEGFRFSGTKSSEHWSETISGVIGFDNKTVYMADDNGFVFCRLVSPDKMEQTYLHITPEHSVAARGILVRKK